MQLQNIHSYGRKVYLFNRDDKGVLSIKEDVSFYPYYYVIDQNGKFDTYDNKKVNKIICTHPKEVRQKQGTVFYESDVQFSKRYLIDKVKTIEPSPTKYLFIDIEVLTPEMPDPKEAKYPVSCVSIYNSATEKTDVWYLGDYQDNGKTEQDLLDDMIKYIKMEKPDIILGWNVSFDYTYLANRITDFGKRISPIGQMRYGDKDNMYPAGISIMDYMLMFKRVYMQEQSYALDKIAQKYLNEKHWQQDSFGVLDPSIKGKNINDVLRLKKLEDMFGILKYNDEIRTFAGCLWEDLLANSKILDIIVLKEAGKRKMVLPNRQQKTSNEELQGAYRRADVGVFRNVYKADVASMYPNQLINFCLDSRNIKDEPTDETITVNGIHVVQDRTALLPYLSSSLIGKKNSIKEEMKHLDIKSVEFDRIKKKYDAIKALVNSLYGVMAFPTFRLFNFKIASSITFLSRELLKYVEDHLEEANHKVHYTDTDALVYTSNMDELDFLNKLVNDWAIENYNKTDIDINFESEGMFQKILILGKCHYYGYIETDKGVKLEIKGMEIKRSSSSKYEAYFQRELIEKILNKVNKNDIEEWIRAEKKRIETLPLTEIAFPCKIANKVYINIPIFVRAYENSKLLFKKIKITKGELFYYIYIKPYGFDKNEKAINVVAIKDEENILVQFKNICKVDWIEIVRRNILMKADTIFKALKWGDIETVLSGQLTLF